jgi:hypothetical protein
LTDRRFKPSHLRRRLECRTACDKDNPPCNLGTVSGEHRIVAAIAATIRFALIERQFEPEFVV